jgi:hypothetical protein
VVEGLLLAFSVVSFVYEIWPTRVHLPSYKARHPPGG